MTSNIPTVSGFREGDDVVLAEGTYQGTTGVFLRLREDANWADIAETQWRRSQSPSGVVAPFHWRDPRFEELTAGVQAGKGNI